MIGFGYDVHRLADGESLVLGGVEIPSAFGTVAHSDGDVLLHALVDALLGAAGLGDIGEHFPDTDQRWKDEPSTTFVRHAVQLVTSAGYRIINADLTLILQAPKILPYKSQMRDHIASLCNLPIERVCVKATTAELIGPVGRGEGVEAYCVVQLDP